MTAPVPPPAVRKRMRGDTAKWLVPVLIYVFTLGAVGVTSKLALKHLQWQDLVLWLGIGHLFSVVALVISGTARPRRVPGTPMAIITALVAALGLISLYVALAHGEASKVVPISAAYPALTLILSAVFLGERLTMRRVVGVAMVVAGVVMVTVSSS
jgi:bacterial/archaeal transporter family protein